jgi:hypothetical protein
LSTRTPLFVSACPTRTVRAERARRNKRARARDRGGLHTRCARGAHAELTDLQHGLADIQRQRHNVEDLREPRAL